MNSDIKCETTAEQRRLEFLTQMSEREELRKEREAALRASRLSNRLEDESNDIFKNKWLIAVKEVEHEMQSLENQHTDMSAASLRVQLDAICDRLDVLQQTLSHSVHFLLPHTHQQAKEELALLRATFQQQRESLQPKKKFSFAAARKPVVQQQIVAKPQPDALLLPTYAIEIKSQLHDLTDVHVTLDEEKVSNEDVLLRNLRGCEVRIRGPPATLHATGLQKCLLLSAPAARSVFLEDCVDCTLVIACQQLRIHRSTNCRIYLSVTSRAIIEDCNNLQLAPYSLNYASFEKHMMAAGLADSVLYWDHVDDFNHLVNNVPSPNWSALPDAEKQSWIEL